MSAITHERDVVYTAFMLRVRDAVDGRAGPISVDLQPSVDQRLAWAVDEWFNYRIRAEHLAAEANAMLAAARAPLFDIIDEAGTDCLAFEVRWGHRWMRFSVDESGRRGSVILERSWCPGDDCVEPVRREVLDELVISMLTDDADCDPTAAKQSPSRM